MINSARLLQTFLDLVQIDSLSLHERRVAASVTDLLQPLGLEVRTDSAGENIGGDSGNLFAYLKPSYEPAASTILLNAHMDTVGPGKGIKPLIVDGLVKTDGKTILGADDKAGMAVIVEVLRVLLERRLVHGGVEVVFTVAEEIGLLGSKNLDLSGLRARHVFILDGEGPVGGIVIRAPSQNSVKATFKGKAAHAGLNPETGINAIQAAAKAISCMRLGRIDQETTANVGVISGGTAANIVPAEAHLEGEARSLSEEKLERQTDEMKNCLEIGAESLGAQVEISVGRVYPSFHLSKEDDIVRVALQAATNLGIQPNLVSTGGGSDTNIFNQAGLTAVNLCVGYRNVHTTEERVPIEDLEKAARYLLEIIAVEAGTSYQEA